MTDRGPSETMLNCGKHLCPQRCHQLYDHSQVRCEFVERNTCPKGHKMTWKCYDPPPKACVKCEAATKRAQAELKKAQELQERRDHEKQEHLEQIAKLDSLIEKERETAKDARLTQERAQLILQKQRDLIGARETSERLAESLSQTASHPQQAAGPDAVREPIQPQSTTEVGPRQADKASSLKKPSDTSTSQNEGKPTSPAKEEWERQKRVEHARNNAIDALMDMIGLEEVKLQVLRIKAKIELSLRQDSDIKQDRLNVVFQGNPGTGMMKKWLHYVC